MTCKLPKHFWQINETWIDVHWYTQSRLWLYMRDMHISCMDGCQPSPTSSNAYFDGQNNIFLDGINGKGNYQNAVSNQLLVKSTLPKSVFMPSPSYSRIGLGSPKNQTPSLKALYTVIPKNHQRTTSPYLIRNKPVYFLEPRSFDLPLGWLFDLQLVQVHADGEHLIIEASTPLTSEKAAEDGRRPADPLEVWTRKSIEKPSNQYRLRVFMVVHTGA